MTYYIIAGVVGAIVKTLLPYPPLDDRVRAGRRWLWSKISRLWDSGPT